jgi:hypothetical protein
LSWHAGIVAAEECRAQSAKLQISRSKHDNDHYMAFAGLDQELHYQLVHAFDSNITGPVGDSHIVGDWSINGVCVLSRKVEAKSSTHMPYLDAMRQRIC